MNLANIPFIMLRCLLLTIIIETSFAFLFKYRRNDLLVVVLVNIMTNPMLNALLICINIRISLQARNIALLILEILAFIVEGFIYKKYLIRKNLNPFVLSFVLNVISYSIGEVINRFII